MIRGQQKRNLVLTVLLTALFGFSIQTYTPAQKKTQEKLNYRKLTSVSVFRAVHLNGVIEKGEWERATANALEVAHGWIAVQNDASFLYILADLTQDTQDDAPLQRATWGDYISLAFDVNLDRRITPNIDKSYGLYPGTRNLGVSLWVGPGSQTGLSKTEAKLGAGFGVSRAGPEPHRIWEISVPLSEINANPGGSVFFGIEAHSQNPAFNDSYPANLMYDFSNLYEIALARETQNGPSKGGGPPAAAGQIGRKVLPDGTIEFLYPDGHRKQIHPHGGFTIIDADGTRRPFAFLESPYPSLPALPQGSNLRRWLEKLNEDLLSSIKSILNNNQAEIDSYLQMEGSAALPDQIITRTRFLYNLIPK